MPKLMQKLKRTFGRALDALQDALRRVGLWPTTYPPLPGDWIEGRFDHRHRAVVYKLFVPPRAAGRRRPLLLMLHGCTQDPEDFAAGTQMNKLALAHNFIVLYPTQTSRDNAARCWNWFLPQHQQRERGEPALLAALTQSIAEAQGADPARIYAAGLSAGGAMAAILGQTYPDLFAAVGVHSGLPSGGANDLMSALTAMKDGAPAAAPPPAGAVAPTIVFHGDADTTVNVRNGELVTAAAVAGCLSDTPPRVLETQGTSVRDRPFTRRIYADARGRVAVEQWVLRGAGHAWSGGDASGSFTDPTGPDASAEMLRFFLAHRNTSLSNGYRVREPQMAG
ncbi:MAG: PHB depolymerase family esterase [Betaproteobacteria bacterium]